MKRIPGLAALIIIVLVPAANAIHVTDQTVPYGTTTIDIGGPREWIVGQTVTPGFNGPLTQVELSVGCTGGALIVEITNLLPGRSVPGSVVRTSTTVDASLLPMPPAPHTFVLDRPAIVSAGTPFAIVLRNDGGSCTAMRGPDGDPYPLRGEGVFRSARTMDPDTWLQFLDFGTSGDLGFTTFIDVPTGGGPSFCLVNGHTTFIPSFLPVCRCIEDQDLRNFRCAMLDPSFFLFRTIPLPLKPGDPFEVKWTLVASAPMKGIVELNDLLPPGFQTTQKGPLTFFVDQLQPGQSITLAYKAIAGVKGGRAIANVSFNGNQQSMETVIDVVR